MAPYTFQPRNYSIITPFLNLFTNLTVLVRVDNKFEQILRFHGNYDEINVTKNGCHNGVFTFFSKNILVTPHFF